MMMDLPPPYSEIDGISGELEKLRDQGVLLDRKTTRALGIAESLKNWEELINEKKEKGAKLIEEWKSEALEQVQKRYKALIEELEEQTEKEKIEIRQKTSEFQEIISSSVCLVESAKNVVQYQHEHDIRSMTVRVQEALVELEKCTKQNNWHQALSTWDVKENGTNIVNDVKLVLQETARSDILSMRETRDLVSLFSTNLFTDNSRISGGSYVFQYSFKTKTYNDKARCHPHCFAVSPTSDIIVPDENNKIIKVFTMSGQLKKTISHPRLSVPGSLCVTKKGEIAVIDNGTKDIKFFDSTGALMGMSATLPGPSCVACNSKNQLVVADMAYKAVYTLTENGNETINTIQYYTAQSTQNILTQQYPYFKAPHYVYVNERDQIIVSDRAAGTILIFEADGTYLETVGQGEELKDPYGVTCDPSGSLVVAENSPGRISLVGSTVNHLLNKRQHSIQSPTYAVVTDDEKLLVGEYLSGLIKVFAPRGMTVVQSPDGEVPPPAYDDIFDTSALYSNTADASSVRRSPVSSAVHVPTAPPISAALLTAQDDDIDIENTASHVWPESQV